MPLGRAEVGFSHYGPFFAQSNQYIELQFYDLQAIELLCCLEMVSETKDRILLKFYRIQYKRKLPIRNHLFFISF